jgi:hypothetical protein
VLSTASSERRRIGRREQAVDLVVPRPRLVNELTRDLARALEQISVGAQAREAQVADPGLACPEQRALTA